MQEINNILYQITTPDYVLIIISLFILILFFVFWLDKVYKAYLWTILWLFIFSLINLSLFSLNDNDIWVNFIRDFLLENRESLWYLLYFLIPFFAFLLPLNWILTFRNDNIKILHYFLVIVFWLFLFSFNITILTSILSNKFFFNIDVNVIENLKNNLLISIFLDFYKDSHIFIFLQKYDSFINFFVIFFIFYKMTIWWIVDFIVLRIIQFFKNKKQEENK